MREQHPRSQGLFPASNSAETMPLVFSSFFLSLLLLSQSKAEICSQDGELGDRTILQASAKLMPW